MPHVILKISTSRSTFQEKFQKNPASPGGVDIYLILLTHIPFNVSTSPLLSDCSETFEERPAGECVQSSTGNFCYLMYQSIPNLTVPPSDHRGFARCHRPGVGFLPNFLCLRGRGSKLRNFCTVFERKIQELLDLFQRNRRQLKRQVFLRCFISIFAKTVEVYCIFTNTYRPFSAISVILIKFSGHPRVTFANAR